MMKKLTKKDYTIFADPPKKKKQIVSVTITLDKGKQWEDLSKDVQKAIIKMVSNTSKITWSKTK